jgi:hypothetical protein
MCVRTEVSGEWLHVHVAYTHEKKEEPTQKNTYNVSLEMRQDSGQGHSRCESDHGDE